MKWESLFAHCHILKKLDEWSIDWMQCWISNVVCEHKTRETEGERENKTSVKKRKKNGEAIQPR
jgi:hypothetical protein